MNFLIIGGLLIIAVAAIVGAVLLAINGEPRTAHTATPAANVGAQFIAPAPHSTNTTSIQNPAYTAPRTAEVSAPAPAMARPTVRLTHEDTLPRFGQDVQAGTSNAQFHELAVELRTLYQHARELEQHLRALTEIVDRMEVSQNGFSGVEEEVRNPTGTL